VLLGTFLDKLERVKCFQQRFEIVEIVHRVYESLWHGIARAFMRCDEPFFHGRVFVCPFEFCPVMKGEIVILTAFVLTFLRHSIDSFAHRLGSSLPGSSLLPVRLEYSAVFLICGHYVAFLAELPRFENSRNVEVDMLRSGC
jgi:hypothetical protein